MDDCQLDQHELARVWLVPKLRGFQVKSEEFTVVLIMFEIYSGSPNERQRGASLGLHPFRLG